MRWSRLLSMSKAASAGDPPYPELHALLQLLNAGRLQELVAGCRALLQARPAAPTVAKLLGIGLRAQGHLQEALAAFDRVIQLSPGDFDAHLNRGITLQGLGRLEQAVESYGRSIELEPGADAFNNRAVALQGLGRYEQSIASCDEAIRLAPSSAIAWYNRGNAQKDLGRFAEAVGSYQQACRLRPDYLQACLNLGNAQKDMGQFDSAVASYRQALQLRPDYAEALFGLSQLTRFKAGDALPANMERLAASGSCTDADRVYLHHALAKAHEDMGEHGKSFENLKTANELHAARLNYQLQGDRQLMALIRQLQYEAGTPAASRIRPIFIVGMPRSGTSLVEQILASHPDVHGAGELHALTDLAAPLFVPRLGARADNPPPIGADEVQGVRVGYLQAPESRRAGKAVITDKMPLNFRWIGLIRAALPEAKIIHVRRDAVATCWSLYRQHFSNGLAFANRFADLAGYYRLYADLMAHWSRQYPDAIHELEYEALTEHQEEETARLLAYCDLPWDPRCLQFHETARPVATASALQVRQKMFRGSSEAWKACEAQLEPLVKALAEYGLAGA